MKTKITFKNPKKRITATRDININRHVSSALPTPRTPHTPHTLRTPIPNVSRTLYAESNVVESTVLSGQNAICRYTKFLHSELEPSVEYANGDYIWYKYGQIHRDGGPAKKIKGILYWFQNGQLHREDGPAVEHPNGNTEWFLDGVRIDKQ